MREDCCSEAQSFLLRFRIPFPRKCSEQALYLTQSRESGVAEPRLGPGYIGAMALVEYPKKIPCVAGLRLLYCGFPTGLMQISTADASEAVARLRRAASHRT